MPNYRVSDNRGSNRPINNRRQRETLSNAKSLLDTKSSFAHAARVAENHRKITGGLSNRVENDVDKSTVAEMRANRLSKRSDMQMAMPKERVPFGTWKDKRIPINAQDEEERKKMRLWCRMYAAAHPIMGICIDIYSRFPMQGAHLESKDPELTKFYEELFFGTLDYNNFLLSMGLEYNCIGEVNTLASFNETLGVWDAEEILNPDDVEVFPNIFSQEPNVRLRIPESIKELVEKREPLEDYLQLEQAAPEFLDAVRRGQSLDVSGVLLSRIVRRASYWDNYGTPLMLRAFSSLLQEESLNAAQDAIADRLYAPFILARLGGPDMLGDGEAWIPDQTERAAFAEDMQAALSADFRTLIYHFGVDIQNVFGRESMPRFDTDYDRLERKELQVWGIGEALLSGGSGQGAFASSALNMELVSSLMTTYQDWIKQHYRKRALVVAEAQEHFDYELVSGKRVPIYEEAYGIDPETGEGYVYKRPKLLIPDLKFDTLNLRDEATERQFLMMLSQAGVPISDSSLMLNVPLEFKDETEKKSVEDNQKAVAAAQGLKHTIDSLTANGLLDYMSADTANAIMMAAQAKQAMQQLQPGVAPEDMVPMGDGSGQDPNAPDTDGMEEEGPEVPLGPSQLPRNQISQRPEISDSMRGATNAKTSRYKRDPSVIGQRDKLTENSVQDAVDSRHWTRSIKNNNN